MKLRQMAAPAPGTVLFIVGMRINKFWAIHKWLPVVIAMPKMIAEQMKNPEIGVIGTPRSFVSGRLIQTQQYWKSYDLLEKYAADTDRNHFPAWKRFNKASRNNNAVGIYHETYVVSASGHENIFINLKKPILIGDAVGVSEVTSNRETSRQRITEGK